ncbi:ring finger protein 12, isoform CRA_a, partial [Rattus norvegicus]
MRDIPESVLDFSTTFYK